MEPPQAKVRHRLVLGKFEVIKVEKGLHGQRFRINIGNSVYLTIDSPVVSDVRVHDWLTLYTEVYADADTGSPPIQ